MNTRLLLSAIAIAAASVASASDMVYSYSESEGMYNWGAKLAQSYDIAIHLEGSAFAGKTLKKVSVPVIERPDNISDYSIWLTSTLALDENKKNVADIMSAEVTPEFIEGEGYGFLTYTLPEGYLIPEGGVYAGYSFTVTKIGAEPDRYPVLVNPPGKEGGLFVHSSKTYRQWQDRSIEIGAVSCMSVTVEGDFAENAIGINPIGDLMVQAGEEKAYNVVICNIGTQPVQRYGYEVKVGDYVYNGEYVFDEPLVAVYNRKAAAEVVFPAVDPGVYDYTVTITTVNGQPNGSEAVLRGSVTALEILPVKMPLMEEFTGGWCGWCPRGWVAMEKMNEFHSDFICISYHDSDKLAINYPRLVDGFPSAVMDRGAMIDPYYGPGNKEFGIEAYWKELCAQVTTVAIKVDASINEEGTAVTATSDVAWVIDPDGGDYRVEYVLVGDGLSDPTWYQSNYYTRYAQGAAGIYLDDFCKGGIYGAETIYGLVYNDVALATSGLKGVDGSVTTTKENEHNIYSYTFDLTKIPLAAKASNLRVVAFVIKSDSSYGKVLNSAKAEVAGFNSITDASISPADIVSEKYFDLSGREVVNPANGLYIKSQIMTDGRVINTKVIK